MRGKEVIKVISLSCTKVFEFINGGE